MIGTWMSRNSATRPTPSLNDWSLMAVDVVVEPHEGGAADELLA